MKNVRTNEHYDGKYLSPVLFQSCFLELVGYKFGSVELEKQEDIKLFCDSFDEEVVFL